MFLKSQIINGDVAMTVVKWIPSASGLDLQTLVGLEISILTHYDL